MNPPPGLGYLTIRNGQITKHTIQDIYFYASLSTEEKSFLPLRGLHTRFLVYFYDPVNGKWTDVNRTMKTFADTLPYLSLERPRVLIEFLT